MHEKVFVAILCSLVLTAKTVHANDQYELVYSDLDHFSESFRPELDEQQLVVALKQGYFDRASPGLTEYARRFNLTPDRLAARALKHAEFFESLGDLRHRISAQAPGIHKAFENLKAIHPGAVFPPVYFVVSGLGSGGQASQVGLLISADRYALDESANTAQSGLDLGLRPPEQITHIVAHELAHIQQLRAQGLEQYLSIYGPNESVLAIAIREGTADFIADLTSGGHINPVAHTYGMAHEQEIWQAFKLAAHNKDTGDWFFVKPVKHPGWPQDIGYFMGYRIVESYYKNANDKNKAFQEILEVTDYDDFLDRSKYISSFDRP